MGNLNMRDALFGQLSTLNLPKKQKSAINEINSGFYTASKHVALI